MTQALTTQQQAAPPIEFNHHQLETLRHTIAKDCNDGQLRLFLEVVAQTGLNPFDRQIYPVVRGGKLTIQTGIDGYRLQAQRTGEYGGSETEWCGPDGIWMDVWLDDKNPPFAARTTVYRNGAKYSHVARWSEFSQTDAGAGMWKKMPSNQLGKCSEAGALRRAFPAELARLFVDAEAGAVEAVQDAEAAREARRPKAPQVPQRASRSRQQPAAAQHANQPEAEPFGADDEPIDAETRELPADGLAPWGTFWNELQKRLPLVPQVRIAEAIGIEVGIPNLKKWYEEHGATLELIDFVADAIDAIES